MIEKKAELRRPAKGSIGLVVYEAPKPSLVRNALKVGAGARKLWNTLGKKPPPASTATSEAQLALLPEANAISALTTRIHELETAAADLQNQMLESSGLIKALAEQNTQLILRIETLHARLWLVGALAVASLGSAATLVVLFLR